MNLEETAAIIHKIAVDKGWWVEPNSALETHALIHSETSEATEAVRNGEEHFWIDENGKPQGEAVELIDGVIRTLDYFMYRKWDLVGIMAAKIQYNRSRPYRHGGKKY